MAGNESMPVEEEKKYQTANLDLPYILKSLKVGHGFLRNPVTKRPAETHWLIIRFGWKIQSHQEAAGDEFRDTETSDLQLCKLGLEAPGESKSLAPTVEKREPLSSRFRMQTANKVVYTYYVAIGSILALAKTYQ